MWTNIIQNLIFKGLNGQFKIVAATQYMTRIKDSTKNTPPSLFKHLYKIYNYTLISCYPLITIIIVYSI